MKKIITQPQLTNTIILQDVLRHKDYSFVGYESAGGLRTMLIRHNNLYGFTYDTPNRASYRLKFTGKTAEEAMRKALGAGRQLVTTNDPSEFARWYTHSIPTRYSAKYIIDLMAHNRITIYDVLKYYYDNFTGSASLS